MPEIDDGLMQNVLRVCSFLGLYMLLFLLAKWLRDVLTPWKLNEELTERDNLAVALCMVGYYLGLNAVFFGAMAGSSQGLLQDLMVVGGYSMLGLLFLNVSRYCNDGIILRTFSCDRQLCEEQNAAVGAVQLGMYVATGLIAGGSINGAGGGVVTAIVFFIVGQCSLFLFTLLYDWFTPYVIQDELKNGNMAAGAALGGNLIALGIIVCNGVAGDFIGWQENLSSLLVTNIAAFIFLPLIRLMMDKLVIPAADLSTEITRDRNLGAGMLEGTVSISFALVLVQVI